MCPSAPQPYYCIFLEWAINGLLSLGMLLSPLHWGLFLHVWSHGARCGWCAKPNSSVFYGTLHRHECMTSNIIAMCVALSCRWNGLWSTTMVLLMICLPTVFITLHFNRDIQSGACQWRMSWQNCLQAIPFQASLQLVGGMDENNSLTVTTNQPTKTPIPGISVRRWI